MPRSRSKKSKRTEGEIILRFEANPAPSNELALRQSIQNAMEQTFGLTRAYTYFDIIEMQPHVSELAIRVANLYAPPSLYYTLFFLTAWTATHLTSVQP